MKKKSRLTNPAQRTILINKDTYVLEGDVINYLLGLLKRYNGYQHISISAAGAAYTNPERKHIVLITVHGAFPRYLDRGLYQGNKDIIIEATSIGDLNFKGMILNKYGECVIGNPFRPINDNDLFSLGESTGKQYVSTGDQKESEIQPWDKVVQAAAQQAAANIAKETEPEVVPAEPDEEILEGELF